MIPKIRFQNRDQSIFVKVLTRRVNRYFKDNNISRNANFHMVIKSICMFLIYLVPYVLVYMGFFSDLWSLLLAVVMGIGMAGIGMSVMHDANHGAYSSNQKVNNMIGICIN